MSLPERGWRHKLPLGQDGVAPSKFSKFFTEDIGCPLAGRRRSVKESCAGGIR